MKKIIYSSFILLAVLFLSGCSMTQKIENASRDMFFKIMSPGDVSLDIVANQSANKSEEAGMANEAETTMENELEPEWESWDFTGSINSLKEAKMGDLQCTFNNTIANSNSGKSSTSGIMYVSSKEGYVRMDGKIVATGSSQGESVFGMIMKPEGIDKEGIPKGWMYNWIELNIGGKKIIGSKLRLEVFGKLAGKTPQAAATGSATTSVDVAQQFNFNCKRWVVDYSKFDLPTGIEFIDITGSWENIISKMPNVPK